MSSMPLIPDRDLAVHGFAVLDQAAYRPVTLLSWARSQAKQVARDWPGTSKAEERRIALDFAREQWAQTNGAATKVFDSPRCEGYTRPMRKLRG